MDQGQGHVDQLKLSPYKRCPNLHKVRGHFHVFIPNLFESQASFDFN